MKFGIFDEDGHPQAFFSDDTHDPTNIPIEAINISDEDWGSFISEQGKWIFKNGVKEPFIPSPVPLNILKNKKVVNIKTNYIDSLLYKLQIELSTNKITNEAQIDWVKLLMVWQLNPDQIMSIRDADNNTQQLSFVEFKEMIGSIFSYVQSKWAVRCNMIDQVLSEEVDTEIKLNMVDIRV